MITRDAMARALREVRDTARQGQAWNYSELECCKLAAKEELCRELAAALGLDLDAERCRSCAGSGETYSQFERRGVPCVSCGGKGVAP